jgi:hypothetical protein
LTLGRIPEFIRISAEGDMPLKELGEGDKVNASFTEKRRRDHEYIVEHLEDDGSIIARKVKKGGE